uniref:Uncharacterized protein n=1 Tax=Helianthus annuus TaxID=4232 RepID=A0A251S7L5_HELAN
MMAAGNKIPISSPLYVTKHSSEERNKGRIPCFLFKTIHSYRVLRNQEINKHSCFLSTSDPLQPYPNSFSHNLLI